MMKPAKIAKPPASTPNTPAVREAAALWRPPPDQEHRRDRRSVDGNEDDVAPEKIHVLFARPFSRPSREGPYGDRIASSGSGDAPAAKPS
jgi:hypothetical protein